MLAREEQKINAEYTYIIGLLFRRYIYRMCIQPGIVITVEPMDEIWRGVVTGSDVLIYINIVYII